ncbi:MAG: hypothetical protein JJE12_11450 [Anaerolineales bacterium]|nr:hypothetical protein [Anaerolineales bacterium]
MRSLVFRRECLLWSKINSTNIRPPSYLDALIPIVVLIILLASAVYLYGADGTSGPIQVALMGIKIGHLKPEEMVQEPLEKAAFYGIGGHRIEATEHEATVTG